jgi:replicative DNA helicase
VIIDYMQLIKPTTKYKVREQEVSEISRKCKMYAKELDVPVIVIAQVGRSAENNSDKRPALRDLRESGSIEQDADVVLFAYRPEYYHIPTIQIRGKSVDSDGVGFVIIGKHRNGETGDIPFTYTPGLTKIDDYKEDHEYTERPF